MDMNYDGDLSKTRTCFSKNTYVFLENYVRVFGKHDRVKNSQVKYTVSYLFSRVHFMVTHPLLVEG